MLKMPLIDSTNAVMIIFMLTFLETIRIGLKVLSIFIILRSIFVTAISTIPEITIKKSNFDQLSERYDFGPKKNP